MVVVIVVLVVVVVCEGVSWREGRAAERKIEKGGRVRVNGR